MSQASEGPRTAHRSSKKAAHVRGVGEQADQPRWERPGLAVWPWDSLSPPWASEAIWGPASEPSSTRAPCGRSPGAEPACQRRRSSSAGGCGTGVEGGGRTAGCSPCGRGRRGGTAGPASQARPAPLGTGPASGWLPSLAAAVLPPVPACSGHSPDMRGLQQGLRAPLVPGGLAQAAGDAGVGRHQKQASVDVVTVHTCGAMSSSSPQLGPHLPEPLLPHPTRTDTYGCTHTHTHTHDTDVHVCSRDETSGTQAGALTQTGIFTPVCRRDTRLHATLVNTHAHL